jgi:hypothetical protein
LANKAQKNADASYDCVDIIDEQNSANNYALLHYAYNRNFKAPSNFEYQKPILQNDNTISFVFSQRKYKNFR